MGRGHGLNVNLNRGVGQSKKKRTQTPWKGLENLKGMNHTLLAGTCVAGKGGYEQFPTCGQQASPGRRRMTGLTSLGEKEKGRETNPGLSLVAKKRAGRSQARSRTVDILGVSRT